VVDGHPVPGRTGAAGIVSHHSSERGAIARRRVGRKEQALRGNGPVQIVLYNPWLDARSPGLAVDLEDRVHVHREVEHDRLPDGLAGEARAGTPGEHRHAVIASDLDRGGDVVAVTRSDDTQRLDRVHARIGGVRGSR